ncbi:rhodanese-like domain-containing protein [Thiohalomonas denitrificans]|uniref:Thiosulfate sulfurtransferase n=1 Tax=Thiohalomonas denitrificans TaxID=415747 RepID=A0A1G5R138_9GAMM|nr:rhodanese-like domain-containing protein [Thiohalomonas denitrificans]SCZ67069.1 thiosulfate sulfurtransferase [Thiohalomonas denitrificans]
MAQPVLRHLTPRESFELLQKNPRAVLIDVRSNMEFLFVGHPRGAVHIPWIDEPDWDVNPKFVRQIRELMLGGVICDDEVGGCAPIVLICRSGKRSVEAGKALIDAGFQDVYNVLDGFEGDLDDNHHRGTLAGWRYDGLPWEQC